MKKEIRFYFLWSLVVSNLFYQEYWGLNALLIAVFTTGIFGYRFFFRRMEEEQPIGAAKKTSWFIAASIWLITAAGVFLGNGWLPVFLYLVSLIYFVSLQNRDYISLPLGIAQGFQSFATGTFRFFADRAAGLKETSGERSSKLIRQILQIAIGFIICIVFLKLYQYADDDFYELTEFLNLDWISWGFVAYYIIIAWFLYGIYFFKPSDQINQTEAALKNDVQINYKDRIQSFFGAEGEMKLARITLAVLCLMLLLFLSLDVRFIIREFGIQRPVAVYSEAVHQGINSLILSLVMVIILISYFFRGSLNSEEHTAIKKMALFWLFLNCILVITTGLKNYDYIMNFGYTYKRLGVLFYLFLCGLGLMFSIYKIQQSKSIWFLLRRTSLSFLAAFSIVSLFNWNSIIAEYNLSHVKKERLDLYYLYELGADTYPYLMNYHLENKISTTPLFFMLTDQIQTTRTNLKMRQTAATWRSLNLRDQQLLAKLQTYNFMHENQLTDRQLSQHQILQP